MLTKLTPGNMPFWNESGLVYCVSDGSISHHYGSQWHMNRWRLRCIGKEWEIPHMDVVKNPFVKGTSLYFSGCMVEDDKPIEQNNFKITKEGILKKLPRNKFGKTIVETGSFVLNGFRKVLGPDITILRVIPCQEQSLVSLSPILITVLDKMSVKSFLYSDRDRVLRRITQSGIDVIHPTIYNGEMIHVAIGDNDTFLTRSNFNIE